MKIEVGKLYQTRDGERARIYATDGDHDYPIHGAVRSDKFGWAMETWKPNGRVCNDGPTGRDIVAEYVEPKPPKYRPYNPDELPAIVGRVVRAKDINNYRVIAWVKIDYDVVGLAGADNTITVARLLEGYEWVDGSPCGVEL